MSGAPVAPGNPLELNVLLSARPFEHTVRSPAGVKWVRLRYRPVNQYLDYATLPMQPTGKPDEYTATIPADQIQPCYDLMYYIETTDTRAHGRIWPDLEVEQPYVVVKLKR